MTSLKEKILKKINHQPKRHRTIFSNEVDYSGWWVMSNGHKTIGQLKGYRPNIRHEKTYLIQFEKPNIVGAKVWTILELQTNAIIRRSQEEL